MLASGLPRFGRFGNKNGFIGFSRSYAPTPNWPLHLDGPNCFGRSATTSNNSRPLSPSPTPDQAWPSRGLSRALPAIVAGPLAGVTLDRFDRKKIMIASDLTRFFIALGFVFCVDRTDNTLLYVLSAILMFASPFSPRARVDPATITSKDELHTRTRSPKRPCGRLPRQERTSAATAPQFLISSPLPFQRNLLLAPRRISAGSNCYRHLQVPARPRCQASQAWQDYADGCAISVPCRCYSHRDDLCRMGPTGGGAAQILFSLFGRESLQPWTRRHGHVWGYGSARLNRWRLHRASHRQTPQVP